MKQIFLLMAVFIGGIFGLVACDSDEIVPSSAFVGKIAEINDSIVLLNIIRSDVATNPNQPSKWGWVYVKRSSLPVVTWEKDETYAFSINNYQKVGNYLFACTFKPRVSVVQVEDQRRVEIQPRLLVNIGNADRKAVIDKIIALYPDKLSVERTSNDGSTYYLSYQTNSEFEVLALVAQVEKMDGVAWCEADKFSIYDFSIAN